MITLCFSLQPHPLQRPQFYLIFQSHGNRLFLTTMSLPVTFCPSEIQPFLWCSLGQCLSAYALGPSQIPQPFLTASRWVRYPPCVLEVTVLTPIPVSLVFHLGVAALGYYSSFQLNFLAQSHTHTISNVC